ncbi:MAG: response regulator [Planctomycetota bacterium]|nr:response regulator [Planctomycetota bacterium]
MKGPFRLLVVEDDPGHAALFQRTLRRAGVKNEVVVLEDGSTALEFLKQEHRPGEDVMLLDLRLPGLDGIGVLGAMRQDPLLADLPVIMTSTTLDPKEEEVCHVLGCDCFLLKPIRHDAFLGALRRLGVTPLFEDAGQGEPRHVDPS